MNNDAAVMLGMVLGAVFTWLGIWTGRRIEWQRHRDYCACEQCVAHQIRNDK